MQENRDQVLDEILYKTDIIELISEVTPLEKKGKNHFGLCPFHHEKTPSFSVNEEKQLYHCFSCKASGNAITFVKETKHLSGPEAIKYLADRANITLEQSKYTSPNQKYYDINQDALNFYQVTLNHTKSGQDALNYLKDRHIDESLITHFELGFAPNKKDALYQAMQKKEHLKTDLIDLGLIKEDNDYIYDIFKDRIMFPLHDADGRVVGFSGRIFNSQDKLAKYMNSPQTVVFEKSKILYNIHRAKSAIKAQKRVVICEGFMDVIAAKRAGIEEVVAVMGTALTSEHIKQLKGLTNTAILAFDGDQAGQDATRKFMNDLTHANFEVKVVPLEGKTDPDDYVNTHGAKAFKELVDHAQDSKLYLYTYYKKDVNIKELTDIERFKKIIFDMIEPLSNLEKNHYIERLSKDLNTSKDILEQDFNAIKRTHLPAYRKIPVVEITDKFKKAERGFIQYFLKDEHFVRRFRHEFKDAMFSDKHARDMELEIFEYYDLYKQSCIVPSLFLHRLNDTLKAYFKKFMKPDNYPYDEKEFEDYLKVMREQNRRNKIQRLKDQKLNASTTEEKITLQQKIDQLNKEAKHGKRKNHPRTH